MKSLLKKILVHSGMPRAVGRVRAPRVAILRYHSVQAVPGAFADTIGEGIIHSASLFADQMEIVSRGFNVVTMDDILLWLQGAHPIPRRAVAVTFDDGFADNFTVAAPLLERFGLRAAFYVTVRSIGTNHQPWFCRLRHAFARTSVDTWNVGHDPGVFNLRDADVRRSAFLAACERCAVLTEEGQDEFLDSVERNLNVPELPSNPSLMMDWDQVADLRKAGHIIGSHTMTHPNLAQISEEEARLELMDSKTMLESRLADRIGHFSYPSPILEPHCSVATTRVVKEAGYASGVTCLRGTIGRRNDPLCLPRISAPKDVDEFHWVLETSLAGHVA